MGNEFKQTRFQQRLENFGKAFQLLQSALDDHDDEEPSDLEKSGIIQRFEVAYELSWKCLKDYLESQGLQISPITPRMVIKKAFSADILKNGQIWIDMIEDRNKFAHEYTPELFDEAYILIRDTYFPEIKTLYIYLQDVRIDP